MVFPSFLKRKTVRAGAASLCVLGLAAGRPFGSLDSASVNATARTNKLVDILCEHPEMTVRDHLGRPVRV